MIKRFNYSYLLGFVKENPKLGTLKKLAEFFGISETALRAKITGLHFFSQKQIADFKKSFNVSDSEICLFFFYECRL